VLKEWWPDRVQERVAEEYDLILVYGERALFDPIESYQFPPILAERTKYCGYVLNQHGLGNATERAAPALEIEGNNGPTVLATAGGGEDGFAMLKAFIGAARGEPWKGVVVTGPMLEAQGLNELEELAARNDVSFHTFVPGMSRFFGEVDGLVTMGGYNTLVEAAFAGVPTVCVPRVSPRSEQLLRARAFEKLGLLRMVHPRQLTVTKLRHEVAATLELSRATLKARARRTFHFDGAECAVTELLEQAARAGREQERRQVSAAS
jgi:predicted glycosyltransferase